MPQAAPVERAGRPVTKSPAAFRTIAEVGADLDLPSHVLRFWESKFPEIKPLKRRGGRRYYRPEDVALLRQIRSLLYTEGYTIKGVQRLLRENGSRTASVPADGAAGGLVEPAGAADGPLPASAVRDALRPLLVELQALRALLREHGT